MFPVEQLGSMTSSLSSACLRLAGNSMAQRCRIAKKAKESKRPCVFVSRWVLAGGGKVGSQLPLHLASGVALQCKQEHCVRNALGEMFHEAHGDGMLPRSWSPVLRRASACGQLLSLLHLPAPTKSVTAWKFEKSLKNVGSHH